MWEWMIIQAAIRLEGTSVPAVLTKLCFLQKQILTVITAVGWALSRLWKKKENYAAIEAMNFLSDHGIKVPEQVSVTGFDDSIYARMVRPRLTTVHQDVGQKAHLAFSRLLRMVAGEQLKEFNIKSPVYLVKRDSVKI